MSHDHSSTADDATVVRATYTLPRPVVNDVERYARIVQRGNRSGFVAAALRAYVDSLRRAGHVRKLRASYSAAAREGLVVTESWEHLDNETWTKLDDLED